MGIRIVCPHCDRGYTVEEEKEGKKLRCKSCEETFVARPERLSSTRDDEDEDRIRRHREDDYEDRRDRRREDEDYRDERRGRWRDEDEDDREPSRRQREDDYEDRPRKTGPQVKWEKVRTGVFLVLIGNWVGIAGTALSGLAALLMLLGIGGMASSIGSGNLAGARAAAETGVLAWVFVIPMGLCNLGEMVLSGIGTGFFMAMPKGRGGSRLHSQAVTAFIVVVSWGAVALISHIVSLSSGGAAHVIAPMGGGSGTLAGLAGLVYLAAMIVLVMFLRDLCDKIRAGYLSYDFSRVMSGFIGYYVLGFVLGLLLWIFMLTSILSASSFGGMASTISASAILMMLMGGILVVASIVVHVWFILALGKLRKALGKYIRHL